MTTLEKVPSGIPGFDYVSMGGLPRGRVTVIMGDSGTGKTIFGCQFLNQGLDQGEGAVFVAMEEPPADIRSNMSGLGMDIPAWEAAGRWAFVDATPVVDVEVVQTTGYDLNALLARIKDAARRTGAERLVLDSLGGLFGQFPDKTLVRAELLRLCILLKAEGLTVLLLGEQMDNESNPYQTENYLADAVIQLRNRAWERGRQRTLEVLKLRGANHNKGEFPYTIRSNTGIHCIPLSALVMKQTSTDARLSTGLEGLDTMCHGGLFKDSLTLIAGPTGTGKSLIGLHFMVEGASSGEQCLLLAQEESRAQILRNARGWGMDLEALEADGLLTLENVYPESMVIEDHLIHIKALLEKKRPQRLLLDSFSALARITTPRSFQEFALALTSFTKEMDICFMALTTTAKMMGGDEVSESNISTLTDTIVLLRYVAVDTVMRRGVQVLKMRGSDHDKRLREFTIDGTGMHVGDPILEATAFDLQNK